MKIEATEDGRKVLDVLNKGVLLYSREISEKLGWSKGKVIRVLNTFLAAGYIQKMGTGYGTKYVKRSYDPDDNQVTTFHFSVMPAERVDFCCKKCI